MTLPAGAFAHWVREENGRPGDGSWLRGVPEATGQLEGYATATSVDLGGDIAFCVSTTSPTLRAKIFRMGYYQGLGARLIEQRLGITGANHPIPPADEFGTVNCDWPVTFVVKIDQRYPPGQYLVRLENENSQYRFIPFMVLDPLSRATFVYLSAVTTWQAYNTWGGFSLYGGTSTTGVGALNPYRRAVRVSFNRPYDRIFANGAADFIGNEFPLLFLVEQLGLDLTYWTDLDLEVRGALLPRHRALLSLGHDEYYSPAMRAAVVAGLARGVNVAFFGANFCYRKVRFEPAAYGQHRLMVNYRSTSDPITALHPSLATVNWSQPPSNEPESTFSGSRYGGVDGYGSLTVVDATSWLWRGTGLSNGSVLRGALGAEFNHFDPTSVNPPNVQILAHSLVGGGYSDVTYAAEPGRGGVFASGTGQWIYRLSNAPRLGGGWIPPAVANVTAPLRVATHNVLALFASGPAGDVMPSVANTRLFY